MRDPCFKFYVKCTRAKKYMSNVTKRANEQVKDMDEGEEDASVRVVISLAVKGFLEILLENIAFYFYAGSQNSIIKYFNGFNTNFDKTVILAVDRDSVELFALVLSIDSMILSIMWFLYVFKNNVFHGKFFQITMFAIDAIFDLFFTFFPLTLVNSRNISVLIGSLNTQSPIVFITSFIPMMLLARKVRKILRLLTKLSDKQFGKLFGIKIRNELSRVTVHSRSVSGVAVHAQADLDKTAQPDCDTGIGLVDINNNGVIELPMVVSRSQSVSKASYLENNTQDQKNGQEKEQETPIATHDDVTIHSNSPAIVDQVVSESSSLSVWKVRKSKCKKCCNTVQHV